MVKLTTLSVMAVLLLLPLTLMAGSLGKYSEGAEAQGRPPVSADMIEQKLNQKMAEAIRYINGLPEEKRHQLNARYIEKLKQAVERDDYLEAAYYRGIISGVDWGIQQ